MRRARPFSLEEFRRREAAVLFCISVFVATAEDTIIAKLEWAKPGDSERQRRDVAGIVSTTVPLPPLHLATEGRTPDGWYSLSSLTVE